jgi:predicted ATPase
MDKIKIKNFGPIKEGYKKDDGWLDIKKVTTFIGNQGSGKSTVAKLVSTLSWIEKAMVKGIIRQDELNTHNRFLRHLQYQRLTSYISSETELGYIGKAFSFTFSQGNFIATKSIENGYILPKIMYVPAERNFLSVVDRPDKLKNLPAPLYTFLDEFDGARNLFASGVELPINNVRFEYDKLNKLAHIIGENNSYRLRLSEASSGFQSTVPLYLVTKYLSEGLNSEEDVSIKENSIEEQRKLEKQIKVIMDDAELTPEVRQASLRQLSASRKPGCFINIVEELEQNLFPSSQRMILNSLLKNAKGDGNKLIITTHSPYIINYLTLAVKAKFVFDKIKKSDKRDELELNLKSIVPIESILKSDDLVIYELNETDGTILKLNDYKGLPSDDNYLNLRMAESNELFANLLEIEDKCR